jgi:FAD/FMN-containing dehydrogenase
MAERTTLENFGRNVVFTPAVFLQPRTEAEVLEILGQHRGRRIRVMGRLHAWSEAASGTDVVLDLRHLNSVRTEERDGRVWATVGAGCTVQRALDELELQAGATLPTQGLITAQSLIGAAATGTHGSGRHSLSHYVDEVRVATYDDAGQPVIRTMTDGPELRAARCSLGCLGVILSVGLWSRPQYRLEEHFQRYATLAEVLAAEEESPLQQFFFVPWLERFEVQHRRETTAPTSGLAWLYRLYVWAFLDVGLHVAILFIARVWRARGIVKFLFRRILAATVIHGWRSIDKSQNLLTMYHQRFRHVEIEMFASLSRLPEAMAFVQELLRLADGQKDALSAATQERLRGAGLLEECLALTGVYTHHYPICVRKVLPDDTLISMASGDEPWYAISFIAYSRPADREGFFQFARTLSRTMTRLFDARPHWGKVCPLEAAEADRLYPGLPTFRALARTCDPPGTFANGWVEELLLTRPH